MSGVATMAGGLPGGGDGPASAGNGGGAGAPGPGTRAHAAVRSFELAAEDILSQAGARRSRTILWAGAVVSLLLLVWAALAQVDEVTRGEARVISSRQLQSLQSLDGGVVSAILVREGEQVEEGQLLLKIDETRATSGARESAAQGFALEARLARLRALAEGAAFKPPAAGGNAERRRILREEQRLYEMRRAELAATVAIGEQQLVQRRQELVEIRSRKAAAERELTLAQQELARTRPLLGSGAVSEVEVIKLEREVNRSRSDAEQAAAQIERVQAAIAEAQGKVRETDLSFRNEARREMADALGKLNALNEGAVALNDKVDKSQIRSPVRGRVQRVLVNTVGGVVQPGRDLVEIVPLDDVLVLEARVHPRDIAFIHPGQDANVKFTAYDFSIYGGLDAKVEQISPDSVIDEKGDAYYLVRVQTLQASLGEAMPIIPGMTAEVDVLTGRKSVLSYLLKPVLKAKERAMRER